MTDLNHREIAPEVVRVTERPKLNFVDGMRAVAALMVLCYHYIGLLVSDLPRPLRLLLGWTHIGHFWVSVFIVISGYCLMIPVLRSPDKNLRGGYGRYFGRRAMRILPPYYCALILSLIALVVSPEGFHWLHGRPDSLLLANFSWGNLLSHLLLLHNLNPDWCNSINLAFWSIGTEWQIYFFFPFLLLPVWRRYGDVAAIAVGLAVALLFPMLLPHQPLVNIGCPWYVGLFAMGMAAASYGLDTDRRKYLDTRPLPVIMLVALVLYLLTKWHWPTAVQPDAEGNLYNFRFEWVKDVFIGCFASCFLVYSSRLLSPEARSRTNGTPKILSAIENPQLVRLGTFSYSLYLTHGIVLIVLNSVAFLLHLSVVMQLMVRTFIGFPAAIAGAYLFYCCVERPILEARRS